MVKKIKTPPVEVKPAAKVLIPKKTKSRRGRKKERTQISVRIDKVLMDIAHRQIEGSSMRITDLIERGVALALREEGWNVPLFHHARLILRDEGVEFSRLIVDTNVMLRFPEVRKLMPGEDAARQAALSIIAGVKDWPNASDVLNLMGIPKEDSDPEAKQA